MEEMGEVMTSVVVVEHRCQHKNVEAVTAECRVHTKYQLNFEMANVRNAYLQFKFNICMK